MDPETALKFEHDPLTGEIYPDQEIVLAESKKSNLVATYLAAGVIIIFIMLLESAEYAGEYLLLIAAGFSSAMALKIAGVLAIAGVVIGVVYGGITAVRTVQRGRLAMRESAP